MDIVHQEMKIDEISRTVYTYSRLKIHVGSKIDRNRRFAVANLVNGRAQSLEYLRAMMDDGAARSLRIRILYLAQSKLRCRTPFWTIFSWHWWQFSHDFVGNSISTSEMALIFEKIYCTCRIISYWRWLAAAAARYLKLKYSTLFKIFDEYHPPRKYTTSIEFEIVNLDLTYTHFINHHRFLLDF